MPHLATCLFLTEEQLRFHLAVSPVSPTGSREEDSGLGVKQPQNPREAGPVVMVTGKTWPERRPQLPSEESRPALEFFPSSHLCTVVRCF